MEGGFKMRRGPFSMHFSKPLKFVLMWSTKMGIFYRENHFTLEKKKKKKKKLEKDLPPLKNIPLIRLCPTPISAPLASLAMLCYNFL